MSTRLEVVRGPASLALRSVLSSDDHGVASGQRATVIDAARGPAVLTVRRTADDDVQDRQVYLSVDGEDWANNTLVRKSVTFDVRPGEHVRFQCINRAHWSGMLFMAFLGAAILTVRLERERPE